MHILTRHGRLWAVLGWLSFMVGLGAGWLRAAGEQRAASAASPAAPAARRPLAILDGSSPWRVLYSLDAPWVATSQGTAEKKVAGPPTNGSKAPLRYMPLYPPKGWQSPDFDDSGWCRQQFLARYYNGESDVRAGGGGGNPSLCQISLRSKFTVTDPQAVKGLKLTLLYRGGVAVYLNGAELLRDHLPPGPIAAGAAAEAYPDKASLKAPGRPWHWYNDSKEIQSQGIYELRVRRVEDAAVPARLLRKGVNVIAVEIHAAPYPEFFAKAKASIDWGSAGLCELRLRGDGPEGLAANVVRPRGLQVWNVNLLEEVGESDWPDPHERRLQPIRLSGVRNGTFSGRVMLSSDEPITNLKASVSPLVSADGKRLPAAALRVRYGAFWGIGDSAPRDDALLEAAPAVAAVRRVPDLERRLDPKQRAAGGLPAALVPGAFQSVAVTATIPKDAAAASYAATLTVSADGLEKPVAVPVEVQVLDWTLPDPHDFSYWCGLIQSPESVAYGCEVPLWSQRHWELIGKSLSWIGQLGGKVLWLNLLAQTEYGNAESMVVWVKGPDGRYTHDFSRVRRYVELAVQHMGKPTFVVCGVWATAYQQDWAWWKKTHPLLTVRDPQTGKLEYADGPYPDSPEAVEFWKPVLLGIRDILKEHGLDERMVIGNASEAVPNKAVTGNIRQILPDVGWEAHRHPPTGGEWQEYEGGKVPVMYTTNIWGAWDCEDPAVNRPCGWKYNYPVPGGVRCWLNRDLHDGHGSVRFRWMAEQSLLAGRPGNGQIGADFWAPKAPGEEVSCRSINCRYPRTADAGAGARGCTMTLLLYPTADGAAATLRYEAVRENIQECEARIFLEKLLTSRPCPLPAGLAKRCQDVLDARTRWHRILSCFSCADPRYFQDVSALWAYSGWEERSAELYRCAAAAFASREHLARASGRGPKN